jgi:C1A family cysteine protease
MKTRMRGNSQALFTVLLVAAFLIACLGASGSNVYADAITQEPVITEAPTEAPTQAPTVVPTDAPTVAPTDAPTEEPTLEPSQTEEPTVPVFEPTLTQPPFVPTVAEPTLDANSFSWELTLDYPKGSDANGSKAATVASGLNKLAVTSKTSDLGNGSYRLTLDGKGNLNVIRQAIYETLLPSFNFLGGSGMVSITTPTKAGSPISVYLESIPNTGYYWNLLGSSGSTVTLSGTPTFKDRYNAPGTTAQETVVLQPTGTGLSTFNLVYQRSFEKTGAITRHLTISIPSAMTKIDLSDPNPPIDSASALSPEGLTDNQDDLASAAALPDSFDWRDKSDVSPIRDQGYCGSCWSFSTTGVMESAVRIFQGKSADLSEQFLISCNVPSKNESGSKYDCGGGFPDIMQYYVDVLGQGQTAAGAVLDSVLPYDDYFTSSGSSVACPSSLSHPYKGSSWGYVGNTVAPTVDQIKQAIYTYGPVSTEVCGGVTPFYDYTGGVYNDDYNCYDHMVDLVGWNNSNQTWILRNSWTTDWGDNGYMYIHWGVSNVGKYVTYIKMTTTKIPTPTAPVGTITDTTPTFSWSKVSSATKYQFSVYKGSSQKYTKTITSSSCSSSNCSNTPTTVLPLGSYTWKVRAYIGGVWQGYSASTSFTVAASTAFDSEFTSNASGWTKVHGSWSVASGYYRATDSGFWATSKHSNTYGTMTYQVKLKRTGTDYNTQGLIFDGTPTSLDKIGNWYNSYMFIYANDGEYSIWEIYNGTQYNLTGWIDSSYITSGVNTLKVTRNQTSQYTQFYINGYRVAYGTLTDFSTGAVGVGFYSDGSSGNKLYVDYAKLSLSAPSSASDLTAGSGGVMITDLKQVGSGGTTSIAPTK